MKNCVSCAYVGTVTVPTPPVAEGESPSSMTVNVCRCNPPQALLIGTPNGPQAITVWPQIEPASDFCGRHLVYPSA